MSNNYKVLALKYRPSNFDELVGQKQTVQILINSLKNKKLHNGFLFSGTRGVGKTTIARIFAKAINCKEGISDKPCGKCLSCEEISQGRSIDLIELDAASNTGVDNMREILENSQYKPSRDRFKIYLIDEIHMLSNSSFNSLLKTLEEPPSHVKFLMATTEPEKIPVTILSRCLQFNLSKIKTEEILQNLKSIMAKESYGYEDQALEKIAQFGDGSMRDALSLLDQAISFSNENVKDKDIKDMLCLVEKTDIIEIIELIVENKANKIIELVRKISHQGQSLSKAINDLISIFHQISIIKTIPSDEEVKDEKIHQLAEQISTQDLQLYYQIAINGKKDISYAPSERIALEMILLRMLAFNTENFSEKKTLKFNKKEKKQTIEKKLIADSDSAVEKTIKNQQEWEHIIKENNFNNMSEIILKNTVFKQFTDNKLELDLDINFKNLLTEKVTIAIESDIGNIFKNAKIKFNIKELNQKSLANKEKIIKAEAKQKLNKKYLADENIQELERIFASQINVESIKSLK